MTASSSPWTSKISTLYGKKTLWKEGPHLEFKKSKTKLSDDLWESYSAFANTGGRIIIFGVDDHGRVEGVENADQQIKNLINCLNNPEKVSVNLTSSTQSPEKVLIESKSIIIIRVPSATNSQKPVYLKGNLSQTYFRQNESDIKCSSSQIQQMLRDKCEEDLSAKFIPDTNWECVDSASWTSYRKRMNSYAPDHPWNELDDKGLL